jgi:hypothetical protein
MKESLPLRERPLDVAFIVFFAINLGFVTYLIDIEQLPIRRTLRIPCGRRARSSTWSTGGGARSTQR